MARGTQKSLRDIDRRTNSRWETEGVTSGWGERRLGQYPVMYMKRESSWLIFEAFLGLLSSPSGLHPQFGISPLSGFLVEKLLLVTNKSRHVMEKSEIAGSQGQSGLRDYSCCR